MSGVITLGQNDNHLDERIKRVSARQPRPSKWLWTRTLYAVGQCSSWSLSRRSCRVCCRHPAKPL